MSGTEGHMVPLDPLFLLLQHGTSERANILLKLVTDFLEGYQPQSDGGANLLFDQFFSQKLYENEEILAGDEGRGLVPRAPISGNANDTCTFPFMKMLYSEKPFITLTERCKILKKKFFLQTNN